MKTLIVRRNHNLSWNSRSNVYQNMLKHRGGQCLKQPMKNILSSQDEVIENTPPGKTITL